MSAFRVVLCGGESAKFQKIACALQKAGIEVQISTLVTDCLCQPELTWDLLLIDMDSLTSFLRGLLPAVRRRFPRLGMVGLTDHLSPDKAALAIEFGLDSYLPKSVEPDQLPTIFPYLANRFAASTSASIQTIASFAN
ncbi:MAG: hypothetical protein ACE5H9_04805 [Anaerolineae bacterium]